MTGHHVTAPDEPRLAPELAAVRPGEEQDWASLEAYLRAQIPALAGEMTVMQFPNGRANLTYLARFGGTRLVVRRPPLGDIAPGAHDMRREYRTLSRLWRHFDRSPRAYLLCQDHTVIGADFIVIEYRPGEVVWDSLPLGMRCLEAPGRRLGLAVADALAELHLVDPREAGLSDLGRPTGFLERQLAGWAQRWSLVATPSADAVMQEVQRRLMRAAPGSGRVAILHNDFKLDNCQFAVGEPDKVISIFDWDMATLGDPLVDLGTLLNYWPDRSDAFGAGPELLPGLATLGLPSRSEMIRRYAHVAGSTVDDVSWYQAFACWKTAVALQQMYMRYCRGESQDRRTAAADALALHQAQRALALLTRA